jgi:Flp pilus assembly protein CpaB
MKVFKKIMKISGILALGLMVGLYTCLYIKVKNQNMVRMEFPVVVADADITPGTVLGPDVLRVVKCPYDMLPPQSAYTFQQVEGRMIISLVVKGEPIPMHKLLPAGIKNCPGPTMAKPTFPGPESQGEQLVKHEK